MKDSELQKWLDSAVKQGKFHSQGSFSLDMSGAARKFGEYALSDPLQILSRMLRAAVLTAPEVEVVLQRKQGLVYIPGFLSGVQQLRSIFDQVLSPVAEERELSIAVNSLVARPFRSLTITRGEPSRIARLTMGPDRKVEVAEAFDLIQTASFTQLEWTEASARSVNRDLDQLADQFRYSKIPIALNGEWSNLPFGRPRGPGMLKHLGADKQILIKPAWFLPATYFWADHHALEFRLFSPQAERNEVLLPDPGGASARLWSGCPIPKGPCFLALACTCDLEAPGRVDWVYRGQWLLSEREEDFPVPGLHAVVSCEGLPFDITGERPQQGQAWNARRQLVRDWANCLHDFLQERYPQCGDGAVHRALFDNRLRRQPLLLPPSRRVKELLGRLSPRIY